MRKLNSQPQHRGIIQLLITGPHIQTTCQQEISVLPVSQDISQNQKFNFLMNPEKQNLFHKYPYDVCA